MQSASVSESDTVMNHAWKKTKDSTCLSAVP